MAIQLDGTTGISTTGNIIADGSLVVGSFNPTSISATGNVSGLNLNTGGNLSVGGNAIVTGDLTVVGNASLSGNIVGDKIVNGNTSVEIQTTNGNANITINGTSNVVVFTANGVDITGDVSASGNVLSGGLISVTGNITGGNILGGANVNATTHTGTTVSVSGNITGGNISTGGVISSVGNIIIGNISTGGVISATGNITGGNVLGGANVNATSLTGSVVSVSGNITGGNFQFGSGVVTGTGNVTGGNLNAAGLSLSSNVVSALNSTSNITTTANISGGYILGNGSLLTGIDATSIQNGTSNVRVVSSGGNVSIGVGGTSNVAVYATTGEYVTGLISATGNIVGGNIATGGLISAAATITGGNLATGGTLSTGGNIVTTGNITNVASNSFIRFDNYGTFSANITMYQESGNGNVFVRIGESTSEGPGIFGLFSTGTIGAIGNLTSVSNIVQFGNSATWVLAKNVSSTGVITATGNVTAGNLNAAGLSLSSNVVSTLNSTSNITTTANVQANYFIGTFAGNVSGNITAPGANTQVIFNNDGNASASSAFTFNSSSNVVSVFGNIIGNNILANSTISSSGNIIGNAELYIGAGATSTGLTNPIIVASATGLAYVQVAARNTANTGSADMVTYADNGTDEQAWTDMGMTGSGFNDTEYTITNANDGYVFVQGNTDGTGGNLVLATGNLGNTADIVFATGGFLDANEKMRFVNATGQFWIKTTTNATSVTSGALRVGGGAGIAGNAYVGGLISAAGNVTGGNLSGTSITGSVVSASGTVTGGNLATGGTASAGGNITGANILTGGLISATGNITGGNILGGANVNATSLTGTTVSVSGNINGGNISSVANITGGNVNTNKIVGTGLTLVSTGNLTLSATGNIDANNEYINNVPMPAQDGDAANKLYVDQAVTTGFTFHEPVFAATVTTLATATGGTITYTQPNGVANGVGATLATTGSFNLIDTANIQTVGTRVLVKDQANAVQNGVYTWANATAIVRSTDTDEYGSASTEAFGLNDYFFTQSGNVNAGAAFIVNAPTGTITFGTSNITFAEFSKSQVYTANTSAGISLNGTVINALVDNTTTAFSGGNIVVKTGAVLTTPNIGAATGTSLSVTGTVTGGNINTGGVISATGNVTGSYFLGNGSQLTGIDATSIQNGTSNVRVVSSGGNVTVSVGGTSNVAVFATTGEYVTGLISASGNITGGNISTGGLFSATGNITSAANVAGANVVSSGLVTATGNIVTTANVSGGNVLSSALIQGVTISASGNVNGANITTAGSVSAAGNLIGGNITTVGLISATGNITSTANISGGNVIVGGGSGGNLTGANIISATTLSASANVVAGNVTTVGLISATGNITGGNVLGGANVNATTHTGTTVSVTGNVNGGNLISAALVQGVTVSASGNVIGGNITTAGQLVSSVATGTAPLVITSTTLVPNLYVARANVSDWDVVQTATTGTYYPQIVSAITGNVQAFANSNLSFNAATGVMTASGYTTAGTVTAATVNAATIGNAAAVHNGATVSVTGTVTAASVVGGVMTGSSLSVSGAVTGAGITGSSLTVGTGTITGGNIVNGNGNGIGNIGSSTVYFNTVFGKATTAQYADLAENYAADAEYTSGTVLEFGGANEVTLSAIPGSARIAGVVSTNPAHLMNSTLESQYVTALALTGRVPTSVVGTVRKGDMMVSAGNGAAQACATPSMGTVLGKALENFDGESGVIEIVVGRL